MRPPREARDRAGRGGARERAAEMEREETQPQSRRTVIFETMSGTANTPLSRSISVVSLFAIVISIGVFCMATLPGMQPSTYALLTELEGVCIVAFTLEYLTKLACATARPGPDKRLWRWMVEPLNVIDLVSILPWYIEAGIALLEHHSMREDEALAMLRVLRLMRLARVFRLGSHSAWMKIFATAMARSIDAFACLLAIGIIACVMFGAVIYELEHTSQPDKFESIPACFYYVVVTLTTLGFGEITPVTAGGRAWTCMMANAGVIIMCMPIAIVAKEFDLAITEHKEAVEKEEAEKAEKEAEAEAGQQKEGLSGIAGRVTDKAAALRETTKALAGPKTRAGAETASLPELWTMLESQQRQMDEQQQLLQRVAEKLSVPTDRAEPPRSRSRAAASKEGAESCNQVWEWLIAQGLGAEAGEIVRGFVDSGFSASTWLHELQGMAPGELQALAQSSRWQSHRGIAPAVTATSFPNPLAPEPAPEPEPTPLHVRPLPTLPLSVAPVVDDDDIEDAAAGTELLMDV